MPVPPTLGRRVLAVARPCITAAATRLCLAILDLLVARPRGTSGGWRAGGGAQTNRPRHATRSSFQNGAVSAVGLSPSTQVPSAG